MREEYSLIKNNIIVEMYNTDDIEKIKQQPEYDTDCQIALREDWHLKGLNILRYQNGKLLSNKEAIEKGIITLKENEYLFDSDYIGVIEPTEKVVDNEIVDKNNEEKYISGLIGDLEYNEEIVNNRMGMYSSQIDPLFMELMQEYFKTIELPKDLKEKFNEILEKKKAIKEEHPKTTSDNFKQTLKDKLDIENLDNLDNLIVKEIKNGKRKTK